jgi:DNA polymerase-3 subunit delta
LTAAAGAVNLTFVSPAELIKELERGEFRPVYYFYGAEDFRIKEAEKYLIGRFLPQSLRTTNHVTMAADRTKFEDILSELSIVPMLGERQVFTITEIQSLKPEQIDKILAFVKPPDANRVIILMTPSARLPRKGTKILKYLTANTVAVEFARLRRDSTERRIMAHFKKLGLEIDQDALKLLSEMIGGDFGGLTAELNKLADYVGDGGIIDREAVAAVSSDYQSFRIYELASLAAGRRYDQAMAVARNLLNHGERANTLIYWLAEHFIGLYLTRNRKRYGSGKQDIAWKFRGQLDSFDNRQLEYIIELIAAADIDLRENIKSDNLIVEELIYSICTAGKTAVNG